MEGECRLRVSLPVVFFNLHEFAGRAEKPQNWKG